MPQKRIAQYHLDIYEDELDLDKSAKWLKKHSGVKSDSEFLRYCIVQLERRIKDELAIIEEAKAAIKEIRKERAR